ncbi:hypothetical protein BZA70DRAFT_83522 [Myxozyma melibiosi]|uniref:RING-type domain-containing protein n=1 Tax=Myxozyma melibiosi TaxID=54550 RepID=A0ABR1F001_9ASCO
MSASSALSRSSPTTTSFLSTSAPLASAAASLLSTDYATIPTPSASPSGSSDESSGISPTRSPGLFYFCIVFGVIMVIVWSFVIAKYCVLRNHRFHFAHATDETGAIIPFTSFDDQALDLGILRTPAARRRSQGQHRHRRGRKLLSQIEVDQRFPQKKYKVWRTERECAGLPAEGGVLASAVASRAPSVRTTANHDEDEVPGAGAVVGGGEKYEMEVLRTVASTSETVVSQSEEPSYASAKQQQPVVSVVAEEDSVERENPLTSTLSAETYAAKDDLDDLEDAVDRAGEENDDDDDDDDDDVEAHPNLNGSELVDGAGDICVICLESLEDDDDVRGLTCGHAFHSSCIDPWLTTRRACCPLCKTDYYIPSQDTQLAVPAATTQRIVGHPGGIVVPRSAVGGRSFIYDGSFGVQQPYLGRTLWQELLDSRFVRTHLTRTRSGERRDEETRGATAETGGDDGATAAGGRG